jgi:cysteine synthase B
MGASAYFKQQHSSIEIIGVQPADGAAIPGIRRWPDEYLPAIFDASMVDRIIDMSQQEAEETTRKLAMKEGILVGISSGGAVAAALQLSQEVENSVIVVIVCDRGDRYLSTGVFPSE